MPAGLPVLQALDVVQHVEPLLRLHAVLVEQHRQLDQGRVLELEQPRGEQVVDGLGRFLSTAVEESLEYEDSIAQFALVLDLALVREKVVPEVHGIGERVPENLHRTGGRNNRRHLGAHRVFDDVGRPRRPADLAAHLDVLDRIGESALVDVGEFPERFVQQILGAVHEATAPVLGHARHGAGPQVGQAALDRVRRGGGDDPVHRHELAQPIQVRPGAGKIAGALEHLDEVVVEVEDPDVPVGDHVEHRRRRVRMGVGAEQRVVVRIEVVLVPDDHAMLRRIDHVHRVRPLLGVRTSRFQMGIEPRRIGHVELRQFERLHIRS